MAEAGTVSFAGFQEKGGDKTAPPFILKDLKGTPRSLSDYKDKVILIHFWASWCVPCKEEMPVLKKLWEELKGKGFVVLAIAEDSKRAAKSFVNDFEIGFPVLIDQYGKVMRSYGVRMLPTSFIVNKKGEVEKVIIGPGDWDSNTSKNLIKGILMD